MFKYQGVPHISVGTAWEFIQLDKVSMGIYALDQEDLAFNLHVLLYT